MNYKKLVNQTIQAINESNDCIWILSAKLSFGEKRLYFEYYETKSDLKHFLSFGSWSDVYIFLKGFQMGANNLRSF